VIITGSKRMSSPMKFLNSSGLISPKPLNRVISALLPSLNERMLALFITVTVDGLFLVPDTE
jgi:hypothetical protein